MNKFFDFIRLIVAFPRGHRIFLRPEYDRLFGKFRHLARFYRRTALQRTRLITVIGSLGKSSTHRAIMAALNCPERNFSFSNYGMSLAENLLKVRPWDRFAALEVGISGPSGMASYAHMIKPDVVVVTSISSEHFRLLPTLEDTRAEKVKMVSSLSSTGIAILNGDDSHVRWMASQTKARIVTYGFGPANEVRATDVSHDQSSTSFNLHLNGSVHPVKSCLLGHHMVYPVLAAVAVAHVERGEIAAAINRLAALTPMPMRMERISLPSGVDILDDSFKSSIETVKSAFATMAQHSAGRKIVVLGDTGSPDGNDRDIYRELGADLAKFADLVICIGSNSMQSVRSSGVNAGMTRAQFVLAGSRISPARQFLQEHLRPGDLVLFKGSDRQRFQRLVLELQGHPVSCGIKFCRVKVDTCAKCPLLNAPASRFDNPLISRFVDR